MMNERTLSCAIGEVLWDSHKPTNAYSDSAGSLRRRIDCVGGDVGNPYLQFAVLAFWFGLDDWFG